MSFDGKIALVTGASRGIGAAIADQLAQNGARVIGTATSDAGADKISERLAQFGDGHQGWVLNISDAEDVQNTITNITKEIGAPQILVNNAGITRDNLMLRMKDDEWDAVINTNLTGVYRVTKACLKGMVKARFGRIISIGSVVGTTGNPGQANYAAAKAGVIGFSKSLAKELGSRGITVNVIAPGFINTDMTANLTDSQKENLLSTIPAARLGAPADIANAVCYLASEGAAYVTGETLHVNGGMAMS